MTGHVCGGWGRIGSQVPPENKEGAAGRFPFVASHDKQGLVMPCEPHATLATGTGWGGTLDEFEAIPERCSNHRVPGPAI